VFLLEVFFIFLIISFFDSNLFYAAFRHILLSQNMRVLLSFFPRAGRRPQCVTILLENIFR